MSLSSYLHEKNFVLRDKWSARIYLPECGERSALSYRVSAHRMDRNAPGTKAAR